MPTAHRFHAGPNQPRSNQLTRARVQPSTLHCNCMCSSTCCQTHLSGSCVYLQDHCSSHIKAACTMTPYTTSQQTCVLSGHTQYLQLNVENSAKLFKCESSTTMTCEAVGTHVVCNSHKLCLTTKPQIIPPAATIQAVLQMHICIGKMNCPNPP